jgi:hypothetical protein
MKKKEIKEVTVIYCDYCGKELKNNYSSIKSEKGIILDFCNTYTKIIETTCFDKYKKENLK